MERYIHYGHKEFDTETVQGIKNAPMHPTRTGGLWAAPGDAEYGWRDWCEAENFRECSQDNSFAFALKGNAKVYHIRSVSDVKNMPLINNGITTWYTPDFEKMFADGW